MDIYPTGACEHGGILVYTPVSGTGEPKAHCGFESRCSHVAGVASVGRHSFRKGASVGSTPITGSTSTHMHSWRNGRRAGLRTQ